MYITVEHLGKKFGSSWIFKDKSYDFAVGNAYAITGRNGSGKSTFLKILMGNILPSKGNIYYFNTLNENIDKSSFYKGLAFCAPYSELIEEFTGEELFNFHIQFKSLNLPLHNFFEELGLKDSVYKPIEQYSSGMKQKLQLGLAFYSNAECIIFDEPTSNLDEKNKKWYLNTVNKIKNDKLLMIASNNKEEFYFCDHELKMD